MKKVFLSVSLMLAFTLSGMSLPAVRGIFSLTPGGGKQPITESTLTNPNVLAISLGGHWGSIATSDTAIDWSFMDAQALRAANAGKKILLRFATQKGSTAKGGDTPDYVFEAMWPGSSTSNAIVPGVTYTYNAPSGGLITDAVFYNPTYLAKKIGFINAVAAHVLTIPTNVQAAITHVAVSFENGQSEDWSIATGTTIETTGGINGTGFARTELQRWQDRIDDPVHPGAGYTTAKQLDAGKQIITAAMNGFPGRIITMATGTAEGLDSVAAAQAGDTDAANYMARTITAWANSTYPGRFSIQRNSVAAKNDQPARLGSGEPSLHKWIVWQPCRRANVMVHLSRPPAYWKLPKQQW